MKINRAYKFRLLPNQYQINYFNKLIGHNRKIYNEFLAYQINLFKEYKIQEESVILKEKLPKKYISDKDSPEMTKFLDNIYQKFPFLMTTSKTLHRNTMLQVCKAFENFWKNNHIGVGFPKFKSKNKSKKSFACSFTDYQIIDNVLVKPRYFKNLKFIKHRDIVGKNKGYAISRHSDGHWYISFTVEQEIFDPIHPTNNNVGIDLGINKSMAFSDDTENKHLPELNKLQERLKRLQKQLSRKRPNKNSPITNNWGKLQKQIAKLHAKIAFIRDNFLHQSTAEITNNYKTIVMEDLKIKNMSKSAKGNKENPGTNVKQKSGLNREILNQAWGKGREYIKYKSAWKGGELILVPPQYTSQTCPKCNTIDSDNRNKENFKCISCGYENDADKVGAINILERGKLKLATAAES